MAKIVVVGSLIYDFTVTADRLPRKGETVVGHRFTMCTGGKGANQAVQAARLGQDVYMVGRVGNDFVGENILANLKKDGINTDFIVIDKDTPTSACCIHVDSNGDNAIIISPEANQKVTVSDVEAARAVIESADLLICQLEITKEATEYAVSLAYNAGVPVMLNPAPASKVSDGLFEKATYVTPNETEAEFFTGISFDEDNFEECAYEMAAKLHGMGCKNVIITLGKRGALISDSDGTRIVSGYKIKAVDATAAGDAFNAAFGTAVANGKTNAEAISFANGAGALAASKAGSQSSLSTSAELEQFLKAQGVSL